MIQNQRESSQETEEQEGWSRSTHQVLLSVVPQARAHFSCMPLLTWHRERSKAASDHIQSLPGDPLTYKKTSSVFKLSYRFPKAGKVPQKSENHSGHFNSQDVMSHSSPHHRATEGVGIYYPKIRPLATRESARLRKVISSCNFRFPHFARSRPYVFDKT